MYEWLLFLFSFFFLSIYLSINYLIFHLLTQTQTLPLLPVLGQIVFVTLLCSNFLLFSVISPHVYDLSVFLNFAEPCPLPFLYFCPNVFEPSWLLNQRDCFSDFVASAWYLVLAALGPICPESWHINIAPRPVRGPGVEDHCANMMCNIPSLQHFGQHHMGTGLVGILTLSYWSIKASNIFLMLVPPCSRAGKCMYVKNRFYVTWPPLTPFEF